MVELALGGDPQSIREIGQRIDGMPQQAIENADGTPIAIYVGTAIPKTPEEELPAERVH